MLREGREESKEKSNDVSRNRVWHRSDIGEIYAVLTALAVGATLLLKWNFLRRKVESEMAVLGYILLALGCLIGLVGDVMFLTVAYKRGLWCFVGCLFIPIVWLVFFFMNLKATAKPFAISTAGLLIACFGGWMAGIQL